MRMTLQTPLLLVATGLLTGCAQLGSLRAMSFNIRYGTADDGENRWANRRELLFKTIRDAGPDILGLQEVLAFQAEELRAALPGYGFVGVGRDDGRDGGEFSPIMFRLSAFELRDSGHVWLSPTPTVPGSKGWDAALPRLATWVLLRGKSPPHAELYVVNTHMDHVGEQARLESARMLRTMAAAHAGVPTLVMGDFNCGPDSPPYAALTSRDGDGALRDPWVELSSRLAGVGTFHAFTDSPKSPRIDFAFCNDLLEPIAVDIDRRHNGRVYPSDHYPVIAEFRIRVSTERAEPLGTQRREGQPQSRATSDNRGAADPRARRSSPGAIGTAFRSTALACRMPTTVRMLPAPVATLPPINASVSRDHV